ncbi:KilA-N domain-containing protein [Pantoea sp.]|uniref:KilA-N domain-containing protein n=1 Tax=Pantoea sp. TaxID=69393 RepID=UPI0028AF5337|nr:KilA-N domain-containing protein [Pantoea sp.]
MNTNTIEALPIAIENHSFFCNEQRMWNLNEIHRVLNLHDNKAPSQWNNKVREALSNSGNFQSIEGKNGGTWATEKGAIAYAMWVSPEFFEMVVDAFIFMRNDAVLRERVAVLQADEANAELSIAAPKADIFDGRLARGGAVPWSWACKALGLAPFKLREGLKRSGKFILPAFSDQKNPYPPKAAFELGYFVWKIDANGEKNWQVTARGYAWMQENASKWRELITHDDRQKAAAKRAAKRSRKVAV